MSWTCPAALAGEQEVRLSFDRFWASFSARVASSKESCFGKLKLQEAEVVLNSVML
jgi:hypothetical protein